MEKRASDEESLITQSSPQVAVSHATNAAEFYMKARVEAKSPADRSRLIVKAENLLTLAEYLKDSNKGSPILPRQDRQLSTRETEILLQSSKLHGTTFLPWRTSHSAPKAFTAGPGKALYEDKTPLPLSEAQLDHFAGWTRPADLFSPLPVSLDPSSQGLELSTGSDLVQDVTADCSVVASLCSAMRLFCRPERSLLKDLMFPFDAKTGKVLPSQSGMYIFRMNFNGCFRRVDIDDRLPETLTDRTLFVTDRRNPTVIWPALIEKAYLKIRGGYDFPGSNSCTDLWVITGWVPEQLFLQRDALDLDQEWDAIAEAFAQGNVIVTLGTGRISSTEEEATGLVGEHDYGVLELDPNPAGRRLLIKNPWRSGETWNELGSTSLATSTKPDEEGPAHLHDQTGIFWMSLADVSQHFESIYLNWNPALFRHRQDQHFTWNLSFRKNMSATVVDNPQYTVVPQETCTVWVLLARHFTDEEAAVIRQRAQNKTEESTGSGTGFMSIYIFENKAQRLQKLSRALYSGPFVDSQQTLAKITLEGGKPYTIVPVQEKLPLRTCAFTLSFFSKHPLDVRAAENTMRHNTEIPSAWTRRTAGGNPGSPSYATNPQFSVTLPRRGPLSLLLATDNPDIALHIDLVWAGGDRVGPSLAVKDLLADSGAYVRGCAALEVPSVDAGTYTVVCSTFEAGQLADFTLRVGSSCAHAVKPVPAEGAGRLRTQLAPFLFGEGESCLRAPLRVSRLTRMCASVRFTSGTAATATAQSSPSSYGQSGPRRSSTPVKVAVVSGRGPSEQVLAVSSGGAFSEPTAGLRTPDFDVEPGGRIEEEGLWVVVERVGGNSSRETFQVEILGDAPVSVGRWEGVS